MEGSSMFTKRSGVGTKQREASL